MYVGGGYLILHWLLLVKNLRASKASLTIQCVVSFNSLAVTSSRTFSYDIMIYFPLLLCSDLSLSGFITIALAL